MPLLIELIRHHFWQQVILIIASYFFYWWSGSIHVLLLLFVTITSYFCGYKLFKAETKKLKRVWLIIGITIPLAVLAYFKYVDWGIVQINSLLSVCGVDGSIPVLGIALPIGISFFTFQALSYVIDIYLKKIEHEPKFYRYLLFIAFFPALVAGPIVRASEFLPQLKNKIHISGENIQIGVTLILWGLFKKMVIADNVAGYVNTVYSNPAGASSIAIILGTILFAIQIYCDFSGYAHIAIGTARIFGFKLPENFNMPYFAHNVQDFWNRWHMTLSRFIKDYIYYPLTHSLLLSNRRRFKNRKVRNKANEWAIYISLIIAMFLCGLWHGAGWTFIIWGVYYGVLMALHVFLTRSTKLGEKFKFLDSNPGLLLKILGTNLLFILGGFIFRANSLEDLGTCIQKIVFFDFSFTTLTMAAVIFGIVLIIAAFILMSIKPAAEFIKKTCTRDYLGLISHSKLWVWGLYIAILVAAILILSPPETPEFIYFAF